ncbi:aromatic ring-hydroxylating oxygenase subunit alpha [Actinomadura harenae]|uniref:Aromatic ring-hydroxylating dioxygenase subunit alpha n=1 Tax=Actinomadura harenae TaxID=2483351 RepID=A0A3M2M4G8_9ACTN|nr:aromatic ring-hydroxylating dioxygenase subunit alpha [Actinomadura harenae]RMI44352.1 aromatic ring-hydroxylating dioxygenase subunit alpha [Actinomadura harenae]
MDPRQGRAFVDGERTLVDRAVFSDPALYQQELGRVFARSWLFLAHETQFGRAGDFFTTFMGADPVIVTRQRDGTYRVLLNSCRHRGMRVCRYDSGNAKAFTCPYHGWSYGTDGTLIAVPEERAAYGERLDRSEWGLAAVPRVETYKGLVFGTWDTEIPPLREYLGDVTYFLDVLLDPDGQGAVMVPGVHKWRMRGNWKLAAEQFAGDTYHVASTHLSAVLAEPGRSDEAPMPTTGFQVAMSGGHGIGGLDGFDYWRTAGFSEEVCEWMAGLADRAERHLGRPRARDAVFFHGNVFPNLSLLFIRSNLRIWHPKGPDAMEVYSWAVVPASAPPAVRRALLLDYQRHFGPSGTWEQDDGEQWHYSAGSGDGFIARGLPLHYRMGHERVPQASFPDFPGSVDDVYSEANQRCFYERWSELMAVPHPAEFRDGARPGIGTAGGSVDAQVVAP